MGMGWLWGCEGIRDMMRIEEKLKMRCDVDVNGGSLPYKGTAHPRASALISQYTLHRSAFFPFPSIHVFYPLKTYQFTQSSLHLPSPTQTRLFLQHRRTQRECRRPSHRHVRRWSLQRQSPGARSMRAHVHRR